MPKRPKAIIILEALLEGQPVLFPDDDHTYMYLDGVFGVTATRTNTARPDEEEEVLLGVDMSLSSFIKLCETIPNSDVFIIGCNTVMRRTNRIRSERREEAVKVTETCPKQYPWTCRECQRQHMGCEGRKEVS